LNAILGYFKPAVLPMLPGGKIVDECITRNIDFLEKAEITIKKWRKKRGK